MNHSRMYSLHSPVFTVAVKYPKSWTLHFPGGMAYRRSKQFLDILSDRKLFKNKCLLLFGYFHHFIMHVNFCSSVLTDVSYVETQSKK